MQQNKSKIRKNPLISVVIPVYDVQLKWIYKSINSFANQTYKHRELYIYVACPINKEAIAALEEWKSKEKKIAIVFGNNKYISTALSQCVKNSSGEYIAFLNIGDELAKNALKEVAGSIRTRPDLEFIYSDEALVNKDGAVIETCYKPDFNLDLLLSVNYISNLAVVKKALGESIGWFRKDYKFPCSYDLILRTIENTKPENIFHINQVLYSRGIKVPSSLPVFKTRNDPFYSSSKVLEDYLKRNKIKGKALEGYFAGTYRVKRKIDKKELVSIIIPFKDRVDLLKNCVQSLLDNTEYKNIELLLINNQSREKKTLDYLDSIKKTDNNIKIYNYNNPFNYSAINNWAVKKTKGKYILFLNNDTEFYSREWLSAMVEHMERDEVGAVGAKLLYKDNTIQHAGFFLSDHGADHAFRYFKKDSSVCFGQLNLIRNCSGCTGACLLVKRAVFEEVKGFDAKNFKTAFNDVDLCLKIRQKGYLIVYTPYAKLYHYESLTRGFDDSLEKIKVNKKEFKYLQKRWKETSIKDPYFNSNLMFLSSNLMINPEAMQSFLKDKSRSKFTIPLNMQGIKHNTGQTSGNLHFCFSTRHEKGHCLFGPGLRIADKLRLKVAFHIEFINIFDNENDLIKLDVYDANKNSILTTKSVAYHDLKSMEEQFDLEIRCAKPQILEFRVYWNKNCDISISGIVLEKI